jgi:putative DNA primase/helicase
MNAITPGVEQIPAELIAERRWLVWKYLPRTGQPKPSKVPFAVTTGQAADPSDPGTWTTFEEAVAAVKAGPYSGIGFALGDGWMGIDLDNVDSDNAEAMRVISDVTSYTEVSPSGNGFHVLVRGAKPVGPNKGVLPTGGEVEVYDSGRYFTVTGQRVGPWTSVEERAAEIAALCARLLPPKPKVERTSPPAVTPPMSDDEILERSRAASNGAKFERLWRGDTSEYDRDESRADSALARLLSFYTQDRNQIERLMRESALVRPKWDERRGATTWLRKNVIENALGLLTETYRGIDREQFKRRLADLEAFMEARSEDDRATAEWLISEMTAWASEDAVVEVPDDASSYLLPMPEIARQGLAHEYAMLMSEAAGTDYNFWYWSFIAYLAATLAPRMRWDGFYRRHLRLYLAIIAEKNTGKSQARDMTHENFMLPIIEELRLDKYRRVRNLNSDAGIYKVALDEAALAGPGREANIVAVPDEFTTLLKKVSIENSALGQAVTEMYEKIDFDAATKEKGSGRTVIVHLSLLGGTTPVDWVANFSALSAQSGLASRMWLVPASRLWQYAPMRPPDPARLATVREQVKEVLRWAWTAGDLEIDPGEALMLLGRWASERTVALRRESGTRVTDHVKKTAALFALMRRSQRAEVQDMEIATALGDWQLAVRDMFVIPEAESKYAKHAQQIRQTMRQLLKDSPGGAVRERDLIRKVHPERWGPGQFTEILKKMEMEGELRSVEIEGRKPAKGWAIGLGGLWGE